MAATGSPEPFHISRRRIRWASPKFFTTPANSSQAPVPSYYHHLKNHTVHTQNMSKTKKDAKDAQLCPSRHKLFSAGKINNP